MDESKIKVERVGGLRVGTHADYPQIEEKALSEEAAREKVRRRVKMIESGDYNPPAKGSPYARTRKERRGR